MYDQDFWFRFLHASGEAPCETRHWVAGIEAWIQVIMHSADERHFHMNEDSPPTGMIWVGGCTGLPRA